MTVYIGVERRPVTCPAASLGRLHLRDLRQAQILSAEFTWRESGLSAYTVLKHPRLLREALQHAVRWQVVVVTRPTP